MIDIDYSRGVSPYPLRFLEEVLWEWVAIQERSARLWREWPDVPWWYGERASISHLAGAIWRSGGAALEEFGVQKKRARTRGRREMVRGRGDLAFTLENRHFTVEAKHCWPPIKGHGVLKASLAAAEEDAQQTKLDTGESALAVVFAAPYVRSASESTMDKLIASWVSGLVKLPRAAMAWVFPKEARAGTLWKPEDAYYPGAAIIVRKV